MKEIKKILFPIILLALLQSCNNAESTATNSDSTVISPSDSPTSGTCDPAEHSYLEMDVIAQEQSLWCWAACGEIVMKKVGGTVITQCEQVTRSRRETGDCCGGERTEGCNHGGWPDFNAYGFTFDTTRIRVLPMDDIKQQIDCDHAPICFAIHYDGGGGHMMVIDGYKTVEGRDSLAIIDPQDDGSYRLLSYSQYSGGYGYTHWKDFFNIKKNSSRTPN